jgi:hypothetical protein
MLTGLLGAKAGPLHSIIFALCTIVSYMDSVYCMGCVGYCVCWISRFWIPA